MAYNSAGIDRFLAGLPDALDEGTHETANVVKAARDPLTPVDTGGLLASGRVAQVAPAHWQMREGDGLDDARAAYTEFGTHKQAAQPHMTPAAEQTDTGAIMAKHLKALERASGI